MPAHTAGAIARRMALPCSGQDRAEIDGIMTLKFLHQSHNGKLYLEPANKRYKPLYPDRKLTAVVKTELWKC